MADRIKAVVDAEIEKQMPEIVKTIRERTRGQIDSSLQNLVGDAVRRQIGDIVRSEINVVAVRNAIRAAVKQEAKAVAAEITK
jgi:hypothetical protein